MVNFYKCTWAFWRALVLAIRCRMTICFCCTWCCFCTCSIWYWRHKIIWITCKNKKKLWSLRALQRKAVKKEKRRENQHILRILSRLALHTSCTELCSSLMVERTEATSSSWLSADPPVASGWRRGSMMWKFLRAEDTVLHTDKEKGKLNTSAETCPPSPSKSKSDPACRPAGSARRSSLAAGPPPAPASGPEPPPCCPGRPHGCSGAHRSEWPSCWLFWRAQWTYQWPLVAMLEPKPGRGETWGNNRRFTKAYWDSYFYYIPKDMT